MNLMSMSFRDFIFRHNPTELIFKRGRKVAESGPVFGKNFSQELGETALSVSGRGYFAGKDCMEEFAALEREFRKSGAGMLELPGTKPFLAVMEELKLTGRPKAGIVEYSFCFREAGSIGTGTKSLRAKGGESLWDIAFERGIPAERLIGLNGHIKYINSLDAGEEVRLL